MTTATLVSSARLFGGLIATALWTLGAAPGACTAPGPFADVPCGSSFAAWIQELVRRGITAGCTATT